MSRFLADSLDLSRLPDPTLVPNNYEVIVDERLAALKARYAEEGVDYDETELELDAGVILEEVDAGREMLARGAINDAGKANMLAFSRGADLEQLGALFGVARMQIAVDEQGRPIFESDARLRRRVQLAPEAFNTAGSGAAYIFHALTVAGIGDASVTNPARGEVVVTVMSDRADPTPTLAEVSQVRELLFRDDIKPLTDILTVQGAEVVTVDLEADLVLYAGPDATKVTADAGDNLAAFLALNKKLGRDLKLGAWAGRLYRDTVHSVLPISPAVDIVATPAQVVWVRTLKLNALGRDE